MSDQELKPCPFCGGEAFTQVFEQHSHSLAFIPDHPGAASVECANCPCGILKDTLDDAIRVWNTRTPPDPMLEELAGALHVLLTEATRYGYDFQLENEIEEGKVAMQKYRESKVQP